MCDKLNETLEEGRSLALKLVDHVLFSMGATSAKIPVTVNHQDYDVSVIRICRECGAVDGGLHQMDCTKVGGPGFRDWRKDHESS